MPYLGNTRNITLFVTRTALMQCVQAAICLLADTFWRRVRAAICLLAETFWRSGVGCVLMCDGCAILC